MLVNVIYYLPQKLHLLENPFVPSIDSKSKNPFLNIPVEEAAKFGIQVPHIIGYTSHEGIIILPGEILLLTTKLFN